MAETKPIPVRLSPEIISRLDAAAERMGNTRAGVIKLCLASFLDGFERKGTAALPLNWETLLDQLDGRTVDSRARVPGLPENIGDSSRVDGIDSGESKGYPAHRADAHLMNDTPPVTPSEGMSPEEISAAARRRIEAARQAAAAETRRKRSKRARRPRGGSASR